MTKLMTTTVALVAISASTTVAQPPRPNESPRAVTLTLAEYNRLTDLANRPPDDSTAPPVPAVLASADLRVRVEANTARGVFNLTGDVLRSGISRVALVNGATLIDASLAGRPLPLVVDGTAHAALLPGPGPFALTIGWGGPLVLAPGRASFVLPVPPAGTARATIDLPGDQADVRLSAGLITRRSTAGGRTVVEATLDPGSATEVWWSMRDSAPVSAAREVRTLADVLTLVTLGDSDVRMVALVDVTVVQGEPRSVEVQLPPGYELTGVSGSSLDGREPRDNRVMLALADPSVRRHQFLLTLERPHAGGSFSLDTGVVSVPGVQRERGEIAVEGVGTLELTATEQDGVQRIDVRELNAALQSLARLPILSAFRYHRGAATAPGLSLGVKRFADAGVLAAVADHAVATTLVTAEGRALTEIMLRVRNHAQPFLKVTLPSGATIVSVEVAGQTAKPVIGADGTRVPLLRPGFQPHGQYTVSFVYMHAGTPFGKKGDLEMALPRVDLPIAILEWEVFVPENYSVRSTGGNVLDRRVADRAAAHTRSPRYVTEGVSGGEASTIGNRVTLSHAPGEAPGQIRGRATDASGAVLPGVTIDLHSNGWTGTATTDGDGTFAVGGVPSGQITVSAHLPGFTSQGLNFVFDQRSQMLEFVMPVGDIAETVSVSGMTAKLEERPSAAPSVNVVNLQRRASGVLPIRVDVPRAGTSHRFVKPLVVDQEATVKLSYKRK